MWSQPSFFSTQNLQPGHCLNFCPAAKFPKSRSSSEGSRLILNSSHVYPWWYSARQSRQYWLEQTGHTKWFYSPVQWNTYWQSAVGQQTISYIFFCTKLLNVNSSNFSRYSSSSLSLISNMFTSNLHSPLGHNIGNLLSSIYSLKCSKTQSGWNICPQFSKGKYSSTSISSKQISH